jgi:hypothetical protein
LRPERVRHSSISMLTNSTPGIILTQRATS